MKNLINKNLVLLFYISAISILQSQSAIENPQITPVSPEAASFARYGNVALNSATGQMSYSVPLYSISAGTNSWPVTLNYNYSGLILEGKPSLSGLGWHLSAGASITKEVRGLPDGNPDGYNGANNRHIDVSNLVTDYLNDTPGQFINQTSLNIMNNFKDGEWDSEVDKYTVNIAGMRFSFKIRKIISSPTSYSVEPYYLSQHNYTVDITMDQTEHFDVASFVVTSDTGVKYYFDFDDRERAIPDPGGSSPYTNDKATAWMLSEIKYTDGKSIIFDYVHNDYSSFDFVANSYHFDLNTSQQFPAHPNVQDFAQDYSDEMRVTENRRQILKKIIFPGGTIDFTTIQVPNTPRLLYDSAVLKDNNTKVVTTYNFNYESNRDALTSIIKNGEKYYGFEYYNVHTPGSLPNFIDEATDKPYDQDSWKYFNNAGNTRAIHNPYDGEIYKANKAPNFSATRAGALKRILYPTEGYTEVEYEQNQVKKPYGEGQGSSQEAFNDQLFINVNALSTNNDRFATVTKTFNYPVRANLSHKIQGNVESGNSIYLDIVELTGSNSDYSACYSSDPITISYYPMVIDDARHKMVNDPTNCPWYPNPIIKPFMAVHFDPDNNCPWYPGDGGSFSEAMGCTGQNTIDQNDSSRGYFWIPPGTYKFTIDVRDFLAGGSLYSEIKLDFYDPALDNNGSLPAYIDVNVGGLRVKKLVDYDEYGNHTSVKHYDYKHNGYSTARLNQTPLYSNRHIWNHVDDNSSYTMEGVDYFLNSYTATNLNHGTPVYYSRIKSHSTESPYQSGYPNGYTIQEFNLPDENLDAEWPLLPKGEDISKAMPYKTTVKNDLEVTQSFNAKTYHTFKHVTPNGSDIDSNSDHPWSFKLQKRRIVNINWNTQCFSSTSACHDDIKGLHDVFLYKEVDLNRAIHTDASTNQGIYQSKTYIYDSYNQLEEVTTTNSNGEIIKMNYEYPYDLSGTTYTNMVSKNQVAIPVTETNYKNALKLSKKETDFIQIGSNGYFPHTVSNAKGSETLEEQLQINYHSDGNIKEFDTKDGDGITTTFIWGYDKTKPIAKIENAKYSDIPTSDINNLQSLSDVDDDTCLDFETCDENTLRTALNNLRNVSALSDAMITTYTYDPFIGVTSTTDPRGYTSYYVYDALNRLQYIKNIKGEVLEEYQYNYRLGELNASISSNLNSVALDQGEDIILTSYVSGGSGNYSYEFTINNANVNTVTTNSTGVLTLDVNSNHQPSFTASVEITDLVTNQETTKTKTIYVTSQAVPLSVPDIVVSPSGVGNKAVGDNVVYAVSPQGGSGAYNYVWKRHFTLPGGGNATQIYTNNTDTLYQQVTLNDCNNFTIECTVTDQGTNEVITKSVIITINSGCPNIKN